MPEFEEMEITTLELAALFSCLGFECLRVCKINHAKSRHKFIYKISQSDHYTIMKEYHSASGLAILAKDYHEAFRKVSRWRANADIAVDGIWNMEETI